MVANALKPRFSIARFLTDCTKLLERYQISARVELSGSSTIFDLPNSRSGEFSYNSRCRLPRNVVEYDVNIIIPKGSDPQGFFLTRKISRTLNAQLGKKETFLLWRKKTPGTLFYSYPEPNVEIEFHLLEEPFVEVTQFWREVFTEEEISYHWKQRQTLLSLGGEYVIDYRSLKHAQYQELERRVLLGFSLSQLPSEIVFPKVFYNDVPELIYSALSSSRLSLVCPVSPNFRGGIRELLAGFSCFNESTAPRRPDWLLYAEGVRAASSGCYREEAA